ncbi:MAG TPA: glycosyltransferase family 2 protein [Methylocella sp.]|nr:glycosyltransferase family 2 protein [Methylocella sp.]
MLPLVSVIIPHYNTPVALQECVLQLQRQTFSKSRFEIIVSDNNSPCGLNAVREAAPGTKVIHASEQGAGPARNAGVAVARGEVLAFIDADCLARTDWIEKGVAGLKAYDFIGGRVIATSEDPLNPNPVEAFEVVFAFDFERYINKVGFTGTGNMFVWRKVFAEVGPFKNAVAEDMEWSFRARAASFRLGYVGDAIVEHPARKSWSELIGRWKRMTAEEYLLYREKPYFSAKWLLRVALMPASIAPHAWRILTTPRLHGLRSRWGAVKVLARLRLWRAKEMLSLYLRSV